MLIYLLFILIGKPMAHCLSCEEVIGRPEDKPLTFEELSSMSPEDINDCLPFLAKEPLRTTDSDFIWTSLADYYQGIFNIPENVLAQLHWVTVAVKAEEYANITISSIDTVRNFGAPYGLKDDQLEAIADRVREDFAGKMPDDYTYYDLRALNQILCVFNRSEIEQIHPAAYKEGAVFIGQLRNCRHDALIGFANLAVQDDAFGPIEKWTDMILLTVGNVAQFLPGEIPKELKTKLEAKMENNKNRKNSVRDLQYLIV